SLPYPQSTSLFTLSLHDALPILGQIFVSNLTLEQLRDVLYARLGRVYSGVKRGPTATTRFDVSVANVRVNQVYVVGEVAQPGASDRKSTRLNSSHLGISYAVFCL